MADFRYLKNKPKQFGESGEKWQKKKEKQQARIV